MPRRFAKKDDAGRETPPAPEMAGELRAELETIIASPEFRNSKRCQTFLRHIVNKTLAGHGRELKERTLAVELFGRLPGADMEHDSAVRVCARHVRLRLERFYASAAGAAGRWRIELPAGSYEPRFIPVAQKSAGEPSAPFARVRLSWRILPFVLAVASLGLFLLWRFLPSTPSAIDEFWGPAFTARRAVILLAQPAPGEASAGHAAVFQAAAAAELFHLFRSRNCDVNIRPAGMNSEANPPTVYIILGSPARGSISSWLDEAWFDAPLSDSQSVQRLREEVNEWISEFQEKLPNISIIFRIPGPPGHPFSVVFAGLSPAATAGAVRLAANSRLLGRFLQALPPEWRRSGLAAAVFFLEGSEGRFQLVKARLWQPRPPAP